MVEENNQQDRRSIWWTLAGVVAGSAAGLGIGFKLGAREKPCACKAKLPTPSEVGPQPEKGGTSNGGSGGAGKKA